MAAPNFVDKTVWTGDNLYILRGMNSECVDLIYLDPPFNSNKNYSAPVGSKAAGAAFKDTWTLSDLDVAWMGLIADEHPAISYMLDAAGKAHGKGMQSYLTMMAVRLLEMRRVLKATGSIYLHCDPTASHYLKMLLDAVVGAQNFRNEIIWKRANAHNDPKRFGRISDTILYYGKSNIVTWNTQHTPYRDDYYKSHFSQDTDGRYSRTVPLDAPRHGEGSQVLLYEWHGKLPAATRTWAVRREIMEQYEREDRIRYTRTGTPTLIQYSDEMPGVPLQNVWTDIPPVNPQARERIGYPTQKPLSLLERIIKASSNEGDVVLDPFCGCATACVAAEKLGRQWVGIDISPKAVELVNMRLQQTMGSLFHNRLVTPRTDIPKRTDIDAPVHYRKNAHVLYGRQEGECSGCKVWLPFRNFTIDHVVPQSKGGTDHLDNLQMLCGACNSLKGDRPQEYLAARLQEVGIL